VKSRVVLALIGVSVWFVFVAARLAVLQVRDHEVYAERASDQQLRVVELDPPRGTIYDARGRELAVSVPVDSLYALPDLVTDPAATAAKLAPVLGADRGELEGRLAGDRRWVWLARKLDPPVAEAVRALDLPGLGFVEESKRYYPMRELAAPLLGYVGTDDEGLRGLEYLYDEEVSGRAAERAVIRDNRAGSLLFPDLSFAEPVPGKDLHLTIDATVQHIVESELFSVVEHHRAKGGWAVVLEPSTGAVLAMATYPPYDANRALEHPEGERIRPVSDVYEPGSTFKVVTAAAALEANLVAPSDLFDCERGQIVLYGTRISDHTPFGILTFRDVIARSSNVGAIKVGLRVGAPGLHQMIRAFGFGERTGIDLPGESPGGVRRLDQWEKITPAYVSFGQGIAVTPIQLAAAVAAIADGGRLHRPFVVRSVGSGLADTSTTAPELAGQPISPSTALQLERILEGVFEEGGTASGTAIPGYRLAGKTGTAQKVIDGHYSRTRFVANFIGFAPARQTRIAALVAIDEPQAGLTSGGKVAAPVFSAIARRVLPYLGVAPERPGVASGFAAKLDADWDGGAVAPGVGG